MAQPIQHHRFTYAEYLQYEQEINRKCEWLDGHVVAMAGGSPAHVRLIAAVTRALAIDPARCEIYSSDLKIRVRATGLATYPDVAVVCGPLQVDDADPNAAINPTILVEVLSPSTEAYDRGEKWAHYQQIPSLQAYVLVDTVHPRLDVYERAGGDTFSYRTVASGQHLTLPCLTAPLAVDALFARPITG